MSKIGVGSRIANELNTDQRLSNPIHYQAVYPIEIVVSNGVGGPSE